MAPRTTSARAQGSSAAESVSARMRSDGALSVRMIAAAPARGTVMPARSVTAVALTLALMHTRSRDEGGADRRSRHKPCAGDPDVGVGLARHRGKMSGQPHNDPFEALR